MNLFRNKKEIIPYSQQKITRSDINSVISVLKSKFITQGPVVEDFENEIAKKTSSKYAISTNSATSALHISCLALGLKSGDILWTSPNTFVASSNCALYCGATIDFVDINISTGLMSISCLKEKLKAAEKMNTLPKIVIPVHFSGASCNMKEIYKLSKKYGFNVIEDASHAIGGSYNGRPVGCNKYSDITVFSFHPVKIITTGEGGMATTNNQKIATKLKDLRSHGITKDKNRFLSTENYLWSYEQQDLGFNYRMSDINASLGKNQLRRLDKIVNERNLLFTKYKSLLENLPLHLLEIPKDVYSSIHLAVILLDKNFSKHHEKIFNLMRNAKIGVQLHYIPIHTQPYYKSIGFNDDDFPNAVEYSKRAISIPLYFGLTFKEQKYVCSSLRKIIENFD